MANRDWGSKTGGGGVASEDQQALMRKERLRQLTMSAVDLAKDPYFMRNHLGSYECKLCLTLHSSDGNYLAHTQGRRHQNNLRRRAAAESRRLPASTGRPGAGANVAGSGGLPVRGTIARQNRPQVKSIRIGRPGYQITKQRDSETGQLSLLFQIKYPEIQAGLQPRHRFMSAFEQRREKPDGRYQYLLFAADPYETVGFKVPNKPVDRGEGRFYTHWDRKALVFTLQFYFAHDPKPTSIGLDTTLEGNPSANSVGEKVG